MNGLCFSWVVREAVINCPTFSCPGPLSWRHSCSQCPSKVSPFLQEFGMYHPEQLLWNIMNLYAPTSIEISFHLKNRTLKPQFVPLIATWSPWSPPFGQISSTFSRGSPVMAHPDSQGGPRRSGWLFSPGALACFGPGINRGSHKSMGNPWEIHGKSMGNPQLCSPWRYRWGTWSQRT